MSSRKRELTREAARLFAEKGYHGTSIGDLAKLIQSQMGTSWPVVTEAVRERPQASEVERLRADNSRAKALLGWTPRHTLADGLADTITWIREHRGRYRIGEYGV